VKSIRSGGLLLIKPSAILRVDLGGFVDLGEAIVKSRRITSYLNLEK
jgi:hypothetical protein